MATAKKGIGNIIEDLIYNKYFWIGAGILAVVIYFYFQGKKAAAITTAVLPNAGAGIPLGWTPNPAAVIIHNAMDTGDILFGWYDFGTDEDLIFNTLQPLTLDQRVAVNNEFNRLYVAESEMTMREWFEAELDGEDLSRVMALFNGATI